MNIVLAVDGNSLVHRAYHAFLGRDGAPGRTTSDGQPIWAVEGLLGFLGVLIERTGASKLVVGFDDADKSDRKLSMPEYKAGRSEKNPDLVSQLKLAPLILKELGIEVLSPAGLEADDVLFGTSSWAKENNMRCVIATSDRDSFALIDDNTSVLRLVNGGADKAEMFGPNELFERYGVKAGGYSLYAAIRGDASDNLPGVTGIGEKGAAQIVGIVNTHAKLLLSLESENPLNGEVTKGVIKKLQDPENLERLALNTVMMQMISVPLPEEHIVELPLRVELFSKLSEARGLKISARTLKGFSGKVGMIATPVAPLTLDLDEGIDENFSYKEDPTKTETAKRLNETWTSVGGGVLSATPKTAAAPVSSSVTPRIQEESKSVSATPSRQPESFGPKPKAFQVPNPRPARSLLSKSLD